MNIFLDTNILYKDYFFKSKFNKELLEIAKEKAITLFISDVVIQELRVQFKELLIEKNKEISKIIKDLKKVEVSSSILSPIDVNAQLKIFDTFYLELSIYGSITIIKTDDEIFPEILQRAINRKMPFIRGKHEFKDAVIWLMYAQTAEGLEEDEAYLLTGNKEDFCSKRNPKLIHEELQSDTEKFIVYKSSFDFLSEHNKELDLIPTKFESYIENLEIDSDFLLNVLNKEFESDISVFAISEAERLDMAEIFPGEHVETLGGERVAAENLVIHDIIEHSITIIKNKALIKGTALISLDIEGYLYNSYRDPGDPDESYIGGGEAFFHLEFSFTLEEDEVYSDFEATKCRIYN